MKRPLESRCTSAAIALGTIVFCVFWTGQYLTARADSVSTASSVASERSGSTAMLHATSRSRRSSVPVVSTKAELRRLRRAAAQQPLTCPLVIPNTPVTVAPGQPAIGSMEAATPDQNGVQTATPTAGIINALCDVTLSFVDCGFVPNSITISCDTNGDGLPDLAIPLTNIQPISAHLTRATLSTSNSGLPGSPFPLSCCGGFVTLTLQLNVGAGDDNIFGPFTETQTCTIDIGRRAPVVISASPTTAECGSPQDLLISGSCFILPDGSAGVTSVFAVDASDDTNVIQATRFAILNPSLIDALFDFGTDSAGKSFLIFVSGPTGTSRNLTELPDGASPDCPLGNEQGVQVTFNCNPAAPTPAINAAAVSGCFLGRTAGGKLALTITGANIMAGAAVTLNGQSARKTIFKNLDPVTNTYSAVVLKGGICGLLPGTIVIANPTGQPSLPFRCNSACP